MSSEFADKYTDQQVLMALLPSILKSSKAHFKKPPTFYMMTEESNEVSNPIERMTKLSPSTMERMLAVTNIELASLAPKIELYKVFYDQQQNIVKEIYMPFSLDSRNMISDIFNNRHMRGDDVGINSVNLVYDNQDVATAESLLGCSINFLFNGPEALIVERGDASKGESFRYSDMLVLDQTESSENIDRDKYDIILKVGYETEGVSELAPETLRDALRTQERMYKLGMSGYEIDFQPNGITSLTVQFDSANIKYFSDNKNEVLGLQKILIDIAQNAGAVSPNTTVQDLSDPAEDTRAAVDLFSLYSGLMRYLVEQQKVRTIPAFEANTRVNPYREPTDQEKLGIGCITENNYKEDSSFETAKDLTTNDGMYVSQATRAVRYFYFGDLLESVIATNPHLLREMRARKYAFILDNTAYQLFKGEEISAFNIAKLPIAVATFTEWFQKNVIDQGIKIYSLSSFIKNIVDNLASSVLMTRMPQSVGSDFNPNLTREVQAVAGGLGDNREITGFTNCKIKDSSNYFYSKTARKDYYEYYCIYDREYYVEKLGEEIEKGTDASRFNTNMKAGRPHFFIGADKGLLKNFSFAKADASEDIAVIQMVTPGNPFQQLWAIYNVQLELVGNNLLSVGKTFFLDPTVSGLGSPFKKGTVSNTMGLGGYYQVETVSHSYYPTWTTSVSARIVLQSSIMASNSTKAKFVFY